MTVTELIAALQSQEPGASATDAIKAIRAANAKAEAERRATPSGAREHYARLLVEVRTHRDSKGNGNPDPESAAFHAIRSEVHEAVSRLYPTPAAADLETTFAGLKSEKARKAAIHEVQKAHNIEMWERADAIVAAANITENGDS